MKTFYTILFFFDTFLLGLLTWIFFQLMGSNHTARLAFVLLCILVCIIALVFISLRYTRPSAGNK